MARALKDESLLKRKQLLWAIEDYFGERIPEDSFKRIMNRVQGKKSELDTEEEIKAAWAIKLNLEDPLYRGNLTKPVFDVAQ